MTRIPNFLAAQSDHELKLPPETVQQQLCQWLEEDGTLDKIARQHDTVAGVELIAEPHGDEVLLFFSLHLNLTASITNVRDCIDEIMDELATFSQQVQGETTLT